MRGLYEPVPIQDIVCNSLGKIERLEGGLVRFYLCITQATDDGGPPEQIVVAKIVTPERPRLMEIMKQLALGGLFVASSWVTRNLPMH